MVHETTTFHHAQEVYTKKVEQEIEEEKHKEENIQKIMNKLDDAGERRKSKVEEISQIAQQTSCHTISVQERRKSMEVEELRKSQDLDRRLSVGIKESDVNKLKKSTSDVNIQAARERRNSLEEQTLERIKHFLTEEEHNFLSAQERRNSSLESLIIQAQSSNHTESTSSNRQYLEELLEERRNVLSLIQEKRQHLAQLLKDRSLKEVQEKAATIEERVNKVRESKNSLDELKEKENEEKLKKLKDSLIEASRRRQVVEDSIREKASKMSTQFIVKS